MLQNMFQNRSWRKKLSNLLILSFFFDILTFVCRVHVFAKSIKNQINQVIQIFKVLCDSEFRYPYITLTTDSLFNPFNL